MRSLLSLSVLPVRTSSTAIPYDTTTCTVLFRGLWGIMLCVMPTQLQADGNGDGILVFREAKRSLFSFLLFIIFRKEQQCCQRFRKQFGLFLHLHLRLRGSKHFPYIGGPWHHYQIMTFYTMMYF